MAHKNIVSLNITKYTKTTYYAWKFNIYEHRLMLFFIQNFIHGKSNRDQKCIYKLHKKGKTIQGKQFMNMTVTSIWPGENHIYDKNNAIHTFCLFIF